MTIDYIKNGIPFIVVILISFLIGSMFGSTSVQSSWRLDAAATECAQFNPSNGHFEWLTNEEK